MKFLFALRLFSQLSNLLLILSLKGISDSSVGRYALCISILSFISAVITFEGTFQVLSRNLCIRRFYNNLFLNRISWLFILFVLYYFTENELVILVCLVSFCLNIDSEYYINVISLKKRILHNEIYYRSLLRNKIILTELCLPLITTASIYFKSYNILFYILFCILILLNIKLITIRKISLSFFSNLLFLPTLSGTIVCLLKRFDTQFYKVYTGFFFGESFLGAIYPAFLVGRVGSLFGNIWYSYYFNQKNIFIKYDKLFKKYIYIIIFFFVSLILSYVFAVDYMFLYLFNWDLSKFIYLLYFIVNLQFLQKTFLRSKSHSFNILNLYNIFLLLTLVLKTILFFFCTDYNLILVVSISVDFILFLFIHYILLKKN